MASRIVRLHYSADPDRGDGEETLVPELGLPLSPWALKQYQGLTKKENYLQEYESDFGATVGRKVFHLDREARLCKSKDFAAEQGVDWGLKFKDAKKDRGVGADFRGMTLCHVDAVAITCITAITSMTAVS